MITRIKSHNPPNPQFRDIAHLQIALLTTYQHLCQRLAQIVIGEVNGPPADSSHQLAQGRPLRSSVYQHLAKNLTKTAWIWNLGESQNFVDDDG